MAHGLNFAGRSHITDQARSLCRRRTENMNRKLSCTIYRVQTLSAMLSNIVVTVAWHSTMTMTISNNAITAIRLSSFVMPMQALCLCVYYYCVNTWLLAAECYSQARAICLNEIVLLLLLNVYRMRIYIVTTCNIVWHGNDIIAGSRQAGKQAHAYYLGIMSYHYYY